jgi:hypothetical protein
MAPRNAPVHVAIASDPSLVPPARVVSPVAVLSALVATASLLVAGCATPPAPAVQVSYARTPVVDAVITTASPVPPKRITRLPLRSTVTVQGPTAPIAAEAGTPAGPAERPALPPATAIPTVAPAAAAPAPPAAAAVVVVNVGQPTEASRPGVVVQVGSAPAITAVAGTSAAGSPSTVSAAPGPIDVAQAAPPSSTPTPVGLASPPVTDVIAPTAQQDLATPTAPSEPGVTSSLPDSTGASPTATATLAAAAPATIAGAVPADQGTFVTSDSKTARYYYSRDDNGWHRIHADHQVWFRTADDLLRAFPNRVLHAAPTRRPTRTPTP